MRIIEVALLVGPLRRPHYAGRGASGVKAWMRFVTFVTIAELAVDGRVGFCSMEISHARLRGADEEI